MCRLLETIKICENKIHDLAYHNTRLNRARRVLFGAADDIDLGAFISPNHPGFTKCRVLCRERVELVEYLPYCLPAPRSLKLVRADDIDYRFKYEDRSALAALALEKGAADEILIVRRGLVTDTSFSNVVFFDGERWLTPARPLLEGTKRAALLDRGAIEEADIAPCDLGRFRQVYLINSLIDLDDRVCVPVGNILPE